MNRIVATLLLALLSGCAVGQRFDYTRASPTIAGAGTSRGTLAAGAQDRRPYVISGNKREAFVGLIRGGFGNPFDVVTTSGRPFSNDVAEVLARALGGSVAMIPIRPTEDREGVLRAIRSASADSAYVVTINEWKTDSGPVTNVYFDLKLEEFRRDASVSRASESRGSEQISGYFWSLNPNAVIAQGAATLLQKKLEELFGTLASVATPGAQKTPVERLKDLQQLLDQGLITQSEYERKRRDIVEGI